MEPTTQTKKAILEGLIAQLEQSRYTNEVMGQTWQTIGNLEAAKTCATQMSENVKASRNLIRSLMH